MQTENWWEVRIGAQFVMMMALKFPPINFGKLPWNFEIQETGFWMTNLHESFIISQPCFFVCEIWMIPCYCCVTQMSSNAKIKALFLPMLSPSWTMEAPLGTGWPWHSMFRSILHRVFPYTQWIRMVWHVGNLGVPSLGVCQAAPLWTMFYPAEPASTFPEDVPWKRIFVVAETMVARRSDRLV